MNDKNLYANDMIHRYASHTFTETTVESETKVEFKNGSSVVIKTRQKLEVVDAYRAIRQDLLDGANPTFLSTTTQKNALAGIDIGTIVYDLTLGQDETYNGSVWVPTTNWVQTPITTLTTTDATQTTIDTLTLDDDSVYLIRASITTIETGGGDLGGGEIYCLAKRLSAGNAAIQGSIEDILRRGTNGSLDFTFTVSGNNVLAKVTGLAATTMKWESVLKYRKLSG